MLVFKYFSPPATESAFRNEGTFTLRFNFPQSYNDPYELFLLPDATLEDSEELAYYENFLKRLPQAPVTCFSRRPDSVVMWAHYGQLSAGVCLALDEDALFDEIDYGFMHDVEYNDEPAVIPASDIQFACTTKKNRHTLSLLEIANSATYFRKRTSWAYEQERRLVVTQGEVEEVGGMFLKTFYNKCVKHIIVGAKASESTRRIVKSWADKSDVETLQMRYSRRLADPYFRAKHKTLNWSGSGFKTQVYSCTECDEPLDGPVDVCEWCELTSADLRHARNSIATAMFIEMGVMEGLPLRFTGIAPRGRKVREREK